MQIIQARGREIPVITRTRRLASMRAAAEQRYTMQAAQKGMPAQNNTDAYCYERTDVLPLSAWINIPDNPQQRDVPTRIAKGRTTHLKKLDPSHRKVVVGMLPDGSMVKVDAHSRAYYWAHGLSDQSPETVIVEFWQCRDINAAKSLYDKFDNPLTGEQGADIVTGAARDHGILFESKILKDGDISTALRELWAYIFSKQTKRDQRHEVMRNSFGMFSNELMVLDNIITSKSKFRSPVIMAALLTLKSEPGAEAFWKAYADGDMTIFNKKRDAVAVFDDRLGDVLKKSSYVRQREVIAQAIGAIKSFNGQKMYSMESGYQAMNAAALRDHVNKKFGGR